MIVRNKTLKVMSEITGLIVAMDKEAALIQGAMTEVREEKRGHLTFYRGRLQAAEVVLHVSGPGKVSAAIGCVELINAYRPSAIINSGVAGGLAISVSNLLLSDRLRWSSSPVIWLKSLVDAG